jgi:hypothetical protein
MTRSARLIMRVRELVALGCYQELAPVALEMAEEYELAVKAALLLEEAVHDLTK